MSEALWVPAEGGIRFQDGPDRVRILVFGRDTGFAYSLMEWVVGPGAVVQPTALPDHREFGPHVHRESEETFLVRAGRLDFLLGQEVRTLNAGDFVRVPAGVRHGYRNVSGAEIDMLVGFIPGGMEELFLEYRTDVLAPRDPAGFAADASTRFATDIEFA